MRRVYPNKRPEVCHDPRCVDEEANHDRGEVNINMDHYVDPNSGAAPQPGGYAGPAAAQKGFAMPNQEAVANQESPLDEEPRPSEYEAPGGAGTTKTVTEIAAAAEKNNPPR